MTTEPRKPPRDEKDWTWVLGAACPDCGFDAAALDRATLPRLVRSVAASFRAALAGSDVARRPAAQVWSPLEYGCHVRDVCTRFDQRLGVMLDQDDPVFTNWDQDETALAERYWAQDPVSVAEQLDAAAEQIARRFAGVRAEDWERPGRRSNGSVFTVDSLGRYFAHDLVHRAHDIGG